MNTRRFYLPHLALIAVSVMCGATAAMAADTSQGAAARANYQQEMAVCNSGQSAQGTATCRREARNALAEALRGRLNDDPGQYRQNALARCGAQKGDDRIDCETRINGQGNTEGSVDGGGVLRSSITIVPVK